MSSPQESPTWSKDGARLLILMTAGNGQKCLGAAVQVTLLRSWALLGSLRLLGTSGLVLHLSFHVSLHNFIARICTETWPNVAVEEECRFHNFGRSCGEQQPVLNSHLLQRQESI